MTFDSGSDKGDSGSDGAVHIWPLRVYFEDTDAGGVVYYANYLKFTERARSEMLRADGFDHPSLATEYGIQIVVRNCVIDYMAPARLDDSLEIRSRIATMGGASLTIRQEVIRRDLGKMTGSLLVTVEVRLACIGMDFRPARLPATLKKALEPRISHRNAI